MTQKGINQLTQTSLPALASVSRLKSPSGPRGHFLLGQVHDMQHNALNLYLRLAREYGDVARIRLLSTPVYFVSHPDGIRQVLQKRHLDYNRRNPSLEPLRLFLGDGLSLSDGALWQRQRHLMQPVFHKQHIAGMATQIVNAGEAFLKRLENRANQDEPLDIHKEMTRLTLSIIGMTLFSLDPNTDNPMGQAFKKLVQDLADYLFLPFPPLSVPTPRNRRIRANLRTLDALVQALIRERRGQKTVPSDLFSLLLASAGDGAGMSDQQLRDEMITLFFAGHETTANLLTWVWYVLSQHPEVEQRLWEEIDTVLHGEYPTVEHLSQFSYARMVIDETLRLYPSVPGLLRCTQVDTNICGYRIPANQQVMVNIYASHRNPAYWDRSEIFDPERFSPDHPCEGARTAFFPFGSGPHLCIGNSFALMETQILMAMIAQRYQLQLVPNQTVKPVQRITIRPHYGLLMRLKERK